MSNAAVVLPFVGSAAGHGLTRKERRGNALVCGVALWIHGVTAVFGG